VTPAVRVAKRALDVAAAAVGLAVTVPLYPLIGATGSGNGAVSGFEFREFSMLKFRTMRPDAEKVTGAVIAKEGDPRVTRVGRFLRKTRLDEIPQFWNVLKGDMSLVGPRPERPELLSNLALAIPFFEERMRNVKPGITGLAQVNLGYSGRAPESSPVAQFKAQLTNPFQLDGADDAEADDMRMKMLFDLAYSANLEAFRTFVQTELSIIVKTPMVMLRGLGR
jgi:lipopolysaccharide/colanic/teichoic acid biosynthesis glycosyltransferase